MGMFSLGRGSSWDQAVDMRSAHDHPAQLDLVSLATFAGENPPERLPEVDVTQRVAHWVHGAVDVAQPVTWGVKGDN